MEDLLQNDEETTSKIELTQSIIESLKRTAPWMKFLSIMGFIACGFIVVGAVSVLNQDFGYFYSEYKFLGFLLYIAMAAIIYFPNKYLYNCSINIESFYKSNEINTLEYAIDLQRKYWSYMGILVIIFLII